ncbi:rRNA adenine dimethylase [Pseudodesulfovibrio sp. JC047]|uniref:class II aldolase/adducin family protein n=1 Tax=Pseudodesulfovibrio sp. JC047 TaxID=2683199 RepID=UPI0013D8459F|nr:class II aldolase/adducin family protein [Pseudodesulfovibrio sp. JC047]NDV19596.1 rRNA adenine dimethylase [Pseudodesulfovibrio sp. JC047]
MKQLCDMYATKLVTQGLTPPNAPLIGGLDAELVWNRQDPRTDEFAKLFETLSINSLVFSKPAEPYATILDFLANRTQQAIRPEDTETRTFLHDIPICREFSASAMTTSLKKRKAVIIPGHGIISCGTVSPEQGFVFYSSTIFACFVLFFSDYLNQLRAGTLDDEYRDAFATAVGSLPHPHTTLPNLMPGPFPDEDTALAAMAESGRHVVGYGLVDSFFGNISARLDTTLFISQTGSSLDMLEGCIDPCPMDGSATTGLTASSELSAHEDVYRRSDFDCILHGHPKFTVIMSMSCDKTDCPHRGECHIKCPECRSVDGIPIVPGEVGTGPTGLCNTLPPAMASSGAAIVHGHGLFTAGTRDFKEPFEKLLTIENTCRSRYFSLIESYEKTS